IQKEIEKGSVGFKKSDHHITFQDACRQSRMDGRPDQPRKLIDRLCVSGFSEMSDCGSASVCCGNSAWMGCDAYSKAMQVKRLTQAKQTGSDLLVTACPKCQIHLRCAMEDPFRADDIKMEITDLTGLIAKTIYWE
ncbi:MAG: (Fe-S)-binding protein, partial [Desulfobacterales bacterium]|nr:(Fe-S)-binding protein [Desulfobacterales bacterium]